MGSRFLGRVRMLTVVCVLFALVIIGRLYLLQVVRGHTYTAKADAQFLQIKSNILDRGQIYFTDKSGAEITAATLKDGVSIIINPTKVEHPQDIYSAVKGFLTLTYDEFRAKAGKAGTQRQVVATHQDASVGERVVALKIPGLGFEKDRWRTYPGGSLAAQALGFVAYNGDHSFEGRYGLERYYNEKLERPGGSLNNNFFVELFGGSKSAVTVSLQQGDLITTLEPSVQAELERQLVAYDSQWHPKLSGGIIMNPQNGEIYAMAVSPTFDLNRFNEETNPLIYANPLVENIYEMGSIIKPLTMAAGIDSGAVTEQTTYNDTGSFEVDKKKISNYDGKARGVIPMQEILNQSLNVGASFIATRMGTSTMRDYFINHYKMGTETGIDMPGEVHGIMKPLQSPRQVDYDTASFGQGIALTPIATARALSTLANGGHLVTPHLVRAVRRTNGVVEALSTTDRERVLQSSTAETVSRMLTEVVDHHLVNGQNKIEHYSVAAKTGTAQIADPVHGGYYSDRYLHSFFGYFPSYDAKYIVFLFALEPSGAKYASQTLALPFYSLTQFLINYYDVPPDR